MDHHAILPVPVDLGASERHVARELDEHALKCVVEEAPAGDQDVVDPGPLFRSVLDDQSDAGVAGGDVVGEEHVMARRDKVEAMPAVVARRIAGDHAVDD